ncbi:ABC transporter permease [Actinoplanes flavus]|uniref:ABC transporter permease n=1 Tax=Actinoplanes flavus TaxID=2820290 RepID=A0ABS3UFG3_9ACTN|nr:ABC transporter permease [Actinoplanes flavus]MBO3736442.1 ABC transporter permease [Actinoplanes flavus]
MNLISAELLKLRTTALWWIFAIILVPLWGLALGFNWLTMNAALSLSEADLEEAGLGDLERLVSGLYTSGQFSGVLLVLLLSAILVTSEFFHLTATSTFLTTPRRERVIIAKMVVAVIIAVVVWLFTTVLNLALSPIVLGTMDQPTYLGEPFVWQAIGLNGLAFVLWSLLGVGAGVLIRSQIGATITLSVVYVIGTQVLSVIFVVLSEFVWEPFMDLRVLVPTFASDLLISGPQLPDDPPRWVGGVILIGYAAVMSVIGTLVTKRRDIG